MIDKALFADWDVSYESAQLARPIIVVSGRWIAEPTTGLTLTEHPEGEGMEHTLILHMAEDQSKKSSREVVFRREVEMDYFDVVAIRFPSGEFERIYLPNYDPRSDGSEETNSD